MNFNLKLQVGATFQLQVSKGSLVVKETPIIPNMVLNSGLDAMGGIGNADITHVHVGSSNVPPDINQTVLQTPVAGTSDSVPNTPDVSIVNTSTKPYYYGLRRTFRFPVGAAQGNLAEVGLGNYQGVMFNRTLITDELGNPTVLSILEDEVLDVVVELRVYPAYDMTGTINLLNRLGGIVSTHTYTGNCVIHPSGLAWSLANVGVTFPLLSASTGSQAIDVSTPTYPEITDSTANNMDQSRPTNRSLRGSWLLSTDQANNGVASIYIPIGNLMSRTDSFSLIGFKFNISPPIPKDNAKTLRCPFLVAWDGYTAS